MAASDKRAIIESLRLEMETVLSGTPAKGKGNGKPASPTGCTWASSRVRSRPTCEDAFEHDDFNAEQEEDEELSGEKAYQRILRWASAREQSTEKARRRLQRGGFSEEAIEEAMERAVRVSAIDDRRYCEALVRQRINSGKGLRPVLDEIESLGFAPEDIEAYRDYLSQGDEFDLKRAVEFLDRKPPHAKNLRDAAYRKLMGQGFASSVASSAARQWSETRAGR